MREARLVKSQQRNNDGGKCGDLETAHARLQRFRKKEARQQNTVAQHQQQNKQQHQAEAVQQSITFGVKKTKPVTTTTAATTAVAVNPTTNRSVNNSNRSNQGKVVKQPQPVRSKPIRINSKGGMAMLKTLMASNKTLKGGQQSSMATSVTNATTANSAPVSKSLAGLSNEMTTAKKSSNKGMTIKRNLQQSYHQRQMKSANTATSGTEAGNSGGGGGGGGGNSSATPTLVNFFKRSNRSSQRSNNKDGGNGAAGNDPRQPVKFETFTDKDRAAAVLLGDADIKTTLEKQLKSERGRYVLPKESPAQVYLAQADFEMRIGGLTTAHGLLNKVNNVTALS